LTDGFVKFFLTRATGGLPPPNGRQAPIFEIFPIRYIFLNFFYFEIKKIKKSVNKLLANCGFNPLTTH